MRDSCAQVANLCHLYGQTCALDDVSLTLPAHKLVGLVGPDGVGKSSLLAVLAGARKIQFGKVEVLGQDLRQARGRAQNANRVAYMPQGLGKNLYPTLSVYENLNFFGRLFGQSAEEREKRIHTLLAATLLTDFARRPAGKLSGGMKQKLALCCALIHDPELLILDEPTTGVDPLSRRQFWELLADIRTHNPTMSVIVATAYMEEAEDFDWLIAMDQGRVLSTGSAGEIKMRTGTYSLDEAFIQLLPEEKRRQHDPLQVAEPVFDTVDAAIEAHHLSKKFGDFTAVKDVSFVIKKGEIFGFLGSNGCGKTTTMKMLTGLLPASEGTASLFGKPIDTRDMNIKMRVGYMSQSFSLYEELSVIQNLELHAKLFHLTVSAQRERVAHLLREFELLRYQDQLPGDLPLGIRQRLSLAVAVVHQPELLILDEPTSGVDPVARDQFWHYLITLSRRDGVTIFISTHFMNEAERCDRISLMHAGKVLASDRPAALVKESGRKDLETAFIFYLEQAQKREIRAGFKSSALQVTGGRRQGNLLFSPYRLFAYAKREAKELIRDPIRIAFALLSPMLLMVVLGYGVSFDVENLRYAVLDYDRSPASRAYLDHFSSSRYFLEQTPLRSPQEIDRRLKSGELSFVIEIPPGFGRDIKRGREPQVNAIIDGAVSFRAETTRSYLQGVHRGYLEQTGLAARERPFHIESRFRYNQEFKSINAILPGIVMLLLVMVPSMMTAVGVVREKELGSIINLYVTPVTRLEFLLGKQLPYVVIFMISFASLLVLAIALFKVPVKGSALTLLLGSLLYIVASTGFGLLISSFVKSQIAAIFAAAIMSTVPSINFSGFLAPVSSIEGGGVVMAYGFPSSYYQQISVGTITKALGLESLSGYFGILLLFSLAFWCLSFLFLRSQER